MKSEWEKLWKERLVLQQKYAVITPIPVFEKDQKIKAVGDALQEKALKYDRLISSVDSLEDAVILSSEKHGELVASSQRLKALRDKWLEKPTLETCNGNTYGFFVAYNAWMKEFKEKLGVES